MFPLLSPAEIASGYASLSSSALNALQSSPPVDPALDVHRGAIDRTTITTQAPPEAMARVRITLANMGIVVQAQSQYRYRCIRPRRHPDTGSSDFSKSQDNTKNLDSDEELDVKDWEVITKTDEALDDSPLEKRETPYVTASDYSFETLPPSKTQSPQPSHLHSAASSPETSYLALVPPLPPSSAASSTSEIELLSAPEEPRAIIYGAREQDRGDEVRFSVELTRLDGLTDTYSLDIRRLRGNLRSYKYIYDEVRRRVAETKGC